MCRHREYSPDPQLLDDIAFKWETEQQKNGPREKPQTLAEQWGPVKWAAVKEPALPCFLTGELRQKIPPDHSSTSHPAMTANRLSSINSSNSSRRLCWLWFCFISKQTRRLYHSIWHMPILALKMLSEGEKKTPCLNRGTACVDFLTHMLQLFFDFYAFGYDTHHHAL